MGEFAFELMDTDSQRANIKVIGVGGGGGNAVNHMIRQGIQGVNFVCANTDTQDLSSSPAQEKIQLGVETSKGLGAGMHPDRKLWVSEPRDAEKTSFVPNNKYRAGGGKVF